MNATSSTASEWTDALARVRPRATQRLREDEHEFAPALRAIVSAEIPVGARAEIHVPIFDSSSEVREIGRIVARGRRAARRVPAIEFVAPEGDCLRFRTGSGAYRFEVNR